MVMYWLSVCVYRAVMPVPRLFGMNTNYTHYIYIYCWIGSFSLILHDQTTCWFDAANRRRAESATALENRKKIEERVIWFRDQKADGRRISGAESD